jgi:peroxiredoxin Q/BCP
MMKAPSFSLTDQHNVTHSLEQYRGSWVVLYFYPKDDTPGCTKEACGFRDMNEEFKNRNVIVLGVSKDSPSSHRKFADKYNLSFPLLSDQTTEMIKAYRAWGEKKFLGKTFHGILRKTYLINPEGMIVKEYEKVDTTHHATELLKDIDTFSQ